MTANRTIFDLPEDVRKTEIYPNSLPKGLCFFAQTSKKAEFETAFLRLLHTTVYAEPESYEQTDETKLAAIAILKRHPELLFKEGIVKDHFGRIIRASAYRLFLGAGDIWALKQVHDEVIPKIKDGAAKALDQFKAQFPNCPWPLESKSGEDELYDARNIAQIKQVIAQLEIIVSVITKDPCSNSQATLDVTKDSIAELCRVFKPRSGEIIETGLHFPLRILNEIYTIYNNQYNSWNVEQLSFFSCAVIGNAEAALTAVDGQSCKNGLKNLDMLIGPDRQDGLYCTKPVGIPEDKAPIGNKLGRTMFVDLYDGKSSFLFSDLGVFDLYNKNGSHVRGWLSAGGCTLACRLLPSSGQLFMENKSRRLWELLISPASSVNTFCP